MSSSLCARQIDAALVEYRSRAQDLQLQITDLQKRKRRAAALAVACTGMVAVLSISVFYGAGLPPTVLAIPLIEGIWGLRTYLQSRVRTIDLAHRLSYFECGIDRMEGNWRGKGRSGMEFVREHHLYQLDLEILEEGSLLELMASTRSEIGAERLADFLFDPITLVEARARQAAVKELRNATRLREEISALGAYQFQNCRRERFRALLDLPILKVPWIVPILLLVCGSASLVLRLIGYLGLLNWTQVARVLIPLLLVQAGIGLALMQRVRIRLRVQLALRGDVAMLRAGVELMAKQGCNSEEMRNLIERLRTGNAVTLILKLERLLIGLERREGLSFMDFRCGWPRVRS